MDPRQVATTDDVRQLLEERGLKQIKVGVFDIDGVMRGKYMARGKFLSSLESGGFGFCDVVLGWDCQDQLYDNATLTGWHLGFGDAQVRLLIDSCRELPLEDNMVFFLGEFAGKHEPLCPRGVLRRVIDNARARGFEPYAACEYEFLVVEETLQSMEDKGWRGLAPMGVSNAGYSVLRNSVNTEFYRGLLDLCEDMDIVLEGLHEETGPGALEAAIAVDKALAAGDKAALFKTFAKVLAQRQGRNASFMAKWDPKMPGQGGHVHVSLKACPASRCSTTLRSPTPSARPCAISSAAFSASPGRGSPWRRRRSIHTAASRQATGRRRRPPGAPTIAPLRSAPSPAGRRRSGWSTASPAPTVTPISRWPAPSPPAYTASNTSSNRRRR